MDFFFFYLIVWNFPYFVVSPFVTIGQYFHVCYLVSINFRAS